ncbi:MAG: AAA family ATPase [Pirellulaceae bacterium]
MKTHKVPVLISCYDDDVYVARVVDGPELSAAATSAGDAFEQVRSQLKRLAQREPDQYWPKIDEFELQTCKVKVRLFYRDGKRQFPASREMKIPVQYVLGRYADNSVECFLVDYDMVFYCPAIRELPQLIDEAVRSAAARMGSRDLAAATPPKQQELKFVRVRLREVKSREDDDRTETLAVVADPMIKRKRKHTNKLALYRETEIANLLSAMQQSSVLLVGESGCGKTTIARTAANQHENVVREIAKANGDVPPPSIVWSSSAENLIAGMQYLGEWEERLETVIKELDSIDGTLLISSLVDLVRLGGTQPADSLAAFLMPYLRRGELRLIVETTPDELAASRRLLSGWVECFQIVTVPPLNRDQTSRLVRRVLSDAGRNHGIEVDPAVAESAARLFAQFMPYQAPPRDVLQLVSDVIEDKRRWAAKQISVSDVVERFTRQTGLPESLLLDSLTLSESDVQKYFAGRVIGQSQAVTTAVNVVLRLKSGLCDPKRPVATMLFCGPTGVGKTQLARSLADYLFGQASDKSPGQTSAGQTSGGQPNLIRLDMSEYANWDAVDRFLLAPDGEVATWIGQLRAKPMSVVLLDEFEKSSPDVHDCLLSALDEGRLTDRFGRTTTLCGSILILTSNVGSKSSAAVGFNGEDNGAMQRAIGQEFRPEFLNRLDDVVVFDPLPAAAIEEIVRKELHELSQRETLQQRRVTLQWDESVVKRIASIGFDPLLGARPLQRAIEREIVTKIARQLLREPSDAGAIQIDLRELMSAVSTQPA